MKKSKATIQDIAKLLNINPSTVSRALNNHPRISGATRQKVLQAAEELNYAPNQIASALRKGKSNIVGVIIPRIDRHFFASIVRGIEQVANQSGYRVLVCQSNDLYEREIENVEALIGSQVDGIFASLASNSLNLDHYKKIKEKGIPLVLFDRIQHGLDVSTVEIDDFDGGYIATKHLIEQGCKRIAHLAGSLNLSIYSNRFNGYRKALEDHHLPFRKDLVFETPVLLLEDGKRGMEKLLKLPTLPDGLFSASDFAALGAMEVAKKHRVKMPEDIAMVGFSNELFGSFITPTLTTVDQFSKEIGKTVAQVFLNGIRQKNEQDIARKIIIRPKLIVRESSLKKKN